MSDEMRSDGVSKTRPALGDVTNLVGKRGYPLISKSGVNTGDDGLRFAKKERRTTENCKTEIFEKENVDCFGRIDSSKGNAIDGMAKVPCEIRKPCAPGARQNADSDTNARSSDDGLDFSKEDYLDSSRLVASQESRSCIEHKGVGCSTTDMDSIKACSCSFCMKAAYIWSDLHYQDIKGRMAAIKKSQKEASILVQRNSRGNEIGKKSILESDLTNKWRSFFLNVEDIFVRESIQLESSLLTLRDLRDNCKSDLNPTDVIHLKEK